jgi:hypothetical protein
VGVPVEPELERVLRAKTNKAPAAKKNMKPMMVFQSLVMVIACSGIGRDGPQVKRSRSRRKWIDDGAIVSMSLRLRWDQLGRCRPFVPDSYYSRTCRRNSLLRLPKVSRTSTRLHRPSRSIE